MGEKKNVIAAAKAASDAIWFNDNSDYLTALWEVVGLLSPGSIAYLERNERPPLTEAAGFSHDCGRVADLRLTLLERWEKLPISRQRMLLDGHAPYIARLEASLAELQARVAAALDALGQEMVDEDDWGKLVNGAVDALRGEIWAEGLSTCPQDVDAGGSTSGVTQPESRDEICKAISEARTAWEDRGTGECQGAYEAVSAEDYNRDIAQLWYFIGSVASGLQP